MEWIGLDTPWIHKVCLGKAKQITDVGIAGNIETGFVPHDKRTEVSRKGIIEHLDV